MAFPLREGYSNVTERLLQIGYSNTDLFFLEADPDNDEPAFGGANLEDQFETTGHLGLLYFHILDADAPTVFSPRQGMNVMSARINDLRMPFAPELALWGEATRQTGVGRDPQAVKWQISGMHATRLFTYIFNCIPRR